jgi:cytochrome c-type biogenesis protein CcmH/NrfG
VNQAPYNMRGHLAVKAGPAAHADDRIIRLVDFLLAVQFCELYSASGCRATKSPPGGISMRRKLVAVAVAALAPVVAMLGYNEYAMRQQRTEEVRAQAAQAARQASSEVERIVEGLRSLLMAVTRFERRWHG